MRSRNAGGTLSAGVASTRRRVSLLTLFHVTFIGACVTVLSIRSMIIVHENRSWGDLAGSAVFVLLVFAYYGWKLYAASPYQAEHLAQYLKTREELERLESEEDRLGNFTGSPEVANIAAVYNEAVEEIRKDLDHALDRARRARRVLARLVSEVKGAPDWFRNLFTTSVAGLVDAIAKIHPGDERLPVLIITGDRAVAVEGMFTAVRPTPIDTKPFEMEELPAAPATSKLDLSTIALEAWKTALSARAEQAAQDAKKGPTVRIVRPQVHFKKGVPRG